MIALGKGGAYCSLALSAIGSGMGTGIAGLSALGAWKKCYAQNRPAPFQLAAFTSAPLSQTIYGMVLMTLISNKIQEGAVTYWPMFLIIGVTAGAAMGVSAWFQGIAAAGACDSFVETKKGFTNNLMILGIVETIALFSMVFAIVQLNSIKITPV
ncbi:MAG: V-type ATP synthase subunit K [Lentisphaerae bacterium GWF2_49_21]|nr:MAG: V-type ATP synthase subunit K [Lentisphaerae bacterium GWF2_49_21]